MFGLVVLPCFDLHVRSMYVGLTVSMYNTPANPTSSKQRNSSSGLHSPAPHKKLTHFQTSTPPLLHKRLHERSKDASYDVVILLIPALRVQIHYKSIIGQTYSLPSSPSSLHLLPTPSTPQVLPGMPPIKVTPGTPISSSSPSCFPHPPSLTPPPKKGIFSVSFVVASTPEDVTLTPSLLEFVEQVVRPTIAATVSHEGGSSDSESTDESDREELGLNEAKKADESPAISFPVDVTIAFHIQPSTVCLSCQPHSRVHCVVQSPDVSFVVSFSLFSPRLMDGEVGGDSTVLHSVTFNNLYVTGCLKTFTMQLLSPQVFSLKQRDLDAPKMEKKEALSLTLGQALIHFSRKSVLTHTNSMHAASVDDTTTRSKLQVSGEYPRSIMCMYIVYTCTYMYILYTCTKCIHVCTYCIHVRSVYMYVHTVYMYVVYTCT